MQDHSHDGVDFTPLWQSLVDSAAENVPRILSALTLLALAFIARHVALVQAVKREAVAAERDIGDGHGDQKHERVKRVIKETWPMARVSKIDSLITTSGKPAADKDRAKRKSLIPKALSEPPRDPPN